MLFGIPQLFFAIPIIIAFSLVYQGTRSECLPVIVKRSFHTMVSLTLLMTIILALLYFLF